VRACPHNNIKVQFRPPGRPIWNSFRKRVDESSKAIILFGVVLISTLAMTEPWMNFIETVSASWMLDPTITYTLFYTLIAVLMPITMFLGIVKLSKLLTKTESTKSLYAIYGYMFIPLGLSMHLAHNLEHLFAEAPSVIPALQRFANKYLNLRLAGRYLSINLGTPNWEITRLVDMQTTFWLQVLTLFAGFILALYAGYRASRTFHMDKNEAFRVIVPMLILAIIFMVLNVYVLGLPMSPRHEH
jgi:hypothetical protein